MYDVVIIGGGVSGLTAGIVAKNRGKSILILEGNDRVGKKLLSTGNGKCNICNTSLKTENYNNGFIVNFLDKQEKFYNFIDSIGLKLKTVEDRIYPYSENANSVLNAMRNRLSEKEIANNCKVDSIVKNDDIFVINGNIHAKNLVLCTGSNASYGQNSHDLARNFGHNVTLLKPSLVPLYSDTTYIKRLTNLRAKVTVKLLKNDRLVSSQNGEILFKDNGISGIAVFMLSSYIARNDGEYKVVVDFAPDLPLIEVEEFINNHSIEGLLAKAFCDSIKMQAEAFNKPLAYVVKNFVIESIALGSIKNAQVTCGGLKLDDFDETLQSKLVKNFYACGEVLDIDGDCGGYNLYWAFISAITVGENIC